MKRGVLILFCLVLSLAEKCQFFPGPPEHPEFCSPAHDNDKDCRFPLNGKCMLPKIYPVSIYYKGGGIEFQCYNYKPLQSEIDDWNDYYQPFIYEAICEMKGIKI